MSPTLLLRLFALCDMKRYTLVVFATMVVVVSLPVLVVFSMGGTVLSFLNGTVSSEQAATRGFYMGPSVPGDTYAWGNCTYWAFAMRLWANDPIPSNWGNANTWDDNARRDGYEVNHIPQIGAVFQTDEGDFGHVAYVVSVKSESGVWVISEMNAPVLNVVSQRTFPRAAASMYTFIHGKLELKS
jgi:surface antigen